MTHVRERGGGCDVKQRLSEVCIVRARMGKRGCASRYEASGLNITQRCAILLNSSAYLLEV